MAKNSDKYAYNAGGAGHIPSYTGMAGSDGVISAVGSPGTDNQISGISSTGAVELGDIMPGGATVISAHKASDADSWATVGGPEQIKG